MKKFIRLDRKGEWRGTEHVSSVGVSSFVSGHEQFEGGVSCYKLDDQAEALNDLREYWFETASITESDLENMQITIFEGELLDRWGSDGEDLAICKRTLKEIDAKEIMIKVNELYWDMECGDITEAEYEKELNKIELL